MELSANCFIPVYIVQKVIQISELYNTNCRGKRDTARNIPRSISFSPLHFVLYLGKSITFGTVYTVHQSIVTLSIPSSVIYVRRNVESVYVESLKVESNWELSVHIWTLIYQLLHIPCETRRFYMERLDVLSHHLSSLLLALREKNGKLFF